MKAGCTDGDGVHAALSPCFRRRSHEDMCVLMEMEFMGRFLVAFGGVLMKALGIHTDGVEVHSMPFTR